MINILFSEDENAGYGKHIWQELDSSENAHYSFYNVFYDVLWFRDDELQQDIINFRTPCMPLLALRNLLVVLDEKGYTVWMKFFNRRKLIERELDRCLKGDFSACLNLKLPRSLSCDRETLPFVGSYKGVTSVLGKRNQMHETCDETATC